MKIKILLSILFVSFLTNIMCGQTPFTSIDAVVDSIKNKTNEGELNRFWKNMIWRHFQKETCP